MSTTPSTPRDGSPTLTFRGGGWVLLLAALLVGAVLVWSLLGPIMGKHPVGDGRNLESYGFDLSTLLVPRDALRPSGNPRGFLPALDEPKHLRGSEMVVYNEQNRPKYVVTSDRVLGIVVAGQAHAWPLTMLNAHEVVNDTVGGVPVLATYSPLCDAAVVFDRRVGGAVRRFEVSGLLVDSNQVFCDKSVEGAAGGTHVPSLFLQLERRAIAGPLAAAGTELSMLPGACITTWADWLAAHPDTTVTLRDPQMVRRMKEISYARYFLSANLEFPAEPLPSGDELAAQGLRLKSPMLVFRAADGWKAVSVEALASKLDADRNIRFEAGGSRYLAHVPAGPATARLSDEAGAPVEAIPCLYFAAAAVLGPRSGLQVVSP